MQIFSPLKMNGIAAGRRSFNSALPVAGRIGVHQVALHLIAAFSPCTAFTSIGKNTITTTTAAFDCQSNPNHITKIGAMPTIGSAAMKLPTGSSPRCKNGDRSTAKRRQQGRAARQ
jgi:hypothetical protein